ncbi:hypothetical protein QA640_36630 [Bradyrhizobium sp. CB82]|uniref:hypothetical protein n=1 Tax=Bradyrhizobium sp. CB82 TaxID=3039159 RepID=UPI0024B1EFB8|nr:hypothetical protein [Bradyrhizobium sp. CB82]WFU39810.1 hypothetical protein QA640_36630 [Bradyrhizobium sp. CB82]
MSRTDVERFVDDLSVKGALLNSVKPTATGLSPIVGIGKSLDYDFTLDEVKSYIRVHRRQKSREKKPEATAGGKHSTGVEAMSSVVQTRELVNSATDLPTTIEPFPSVAAVVLVVVIVVVVA